MLDTLRISKYWNCTVLKMLNVFKISHIGKNVKNSEIEITENVKDIFKNRKMHQICLKYFKISRMFKNVSNVQNVQNIEIVGIILSWIYRRLEQKRQNCGNDLKYQKFSNSELKWWHFWKCPNIESKKRYWKRLKR